MNRCALCGLFSKWKYLRRRDNGIPWDFYGADEWMEHAPGHGCAAGLNKGEKA